MAKFAIALFLFLSFLTPLAGIGQYAETIQSDRPGASDNPNTPGQGIFQLQVGGGFLGLQNIPTGTTSQGPVFPLQLRYGILEKLEFRTVASWRFENVRSTRSSQDFGGLALVSFGLRYNIIGGVDRKMSLGIQGDGRVQRVGAPEYQAETISPRVFLLFNTPLLKNLYLTMNAGIVWRDGVNDSFSAYTLNLSYSLSEKSSVFAETFGNIYFEGEGYNFNFGSAYLVNNDLQLDVTLAAIGVTGETQGVRLTFGVSWRFGINRKTREG